MNTLMTLSYILGALVLITFMLLAIMLKVSENNENNNHKK